MIRICILVNYLIGCFTCRYYLQKEGYTGMKLICSLFITFLKIGAFTFGGGYAMIALLENEFVEKKKWLEKATGTKLNMSAQKWHRPLPKRRMQKKTYNLVLRLLP